MQMKSKVVLEKCENYILEDSITKISNIFIEFGGINNFFKYGQKVMLKPNLIMGDHFSLGSVTHPKILEALIVLLRSEGVKVFIGDSPAFGDIYSVTKAAGYSDIIKKYNISLVQFKANRNIYRNFDKKNELLQKLNFIDKAKVKFLSSISSSVNDFDVIVNVPKLKVHDQMTLTCAVKNLYGLIAGKSKVIRHLLVNNDMELFSLFILQILNRSLPELTIVDAIDTLEQKGPRGGVVTKRGMLFAGTSSLAVDVVIASMIGIEISKVPLLLYANKYELKDSSIAEIDFINKDKLVLDDFKLSEELIPISFSLFRVIKSITKHLILLAKK